MESALASLFFRAGAKWLLALLFVLLALLPQIALAQTPPYEFIDQCFAVADELPGSANLQTDTLTRLDRKTGQSFVIGQTGSTNMENLAFGPGRTLYGVDGGRLGTLNTNTGIFTALPSATGTGRGSDGNISLNNVDGLSYDVTRGIFFAIHRRNDGSTNATVQPDLLFAINRQTGALVPNQFGNGIDYVVVPPVLDVDRNLLLGDVDDISFHPATGALYGLLNTNGKGAKLVTIDVTTGAINDGKVITYPNPYPANPPLAGQVIEDIEGLSFFNTGQLFASTGTNGPQLSTNRLFDIDITTGTGELIGPFPNQPAGAAPRDYEGLACLTAEAAIVLDKFTNGPGQAPDDADDPTGPFIRTGDPVTWTYLFTNTGFVTLTEFSLVDDRIGAVNCPPANTLLGPGQSFTCTATGTATPGQYANTGTITGTTQIGLLTPRQTVTDTDPSHYFGVLPAIVIKKYTNGEDADTPTGPQIPVGGAVTWTYVVTNTGSEFLTSVTVTDDKGVVVNCPKNTLAAGEVMTCTANGTATAGQYANIGTVTGTPPSGPNVTSNDPSHYFGVLPAIAIKKYTNGEDADTPTGPQIPVGGAVTWTYVVTNTGNEALTNVTVTDDKGVVVTCPKNTLAVGEVMTCTANGTATAGQYANIGTVTGTPPSGPNVTSNDPSHYFGVLPAIAIKKYTNGEDADTPTGPQIPVGGAVTWTYVVTNTGNEALTNVTVTDDKGVVVTCPKNTLAVGEVMTCTANGTATAGQYANIGTVTGTPPSGPNVTSNDPSHYFGFVPGQATGAIGDRVWNDVDKNGVQDAGETGVPGVTVRLYTSVGGTLTLTRTTTTNDQGLYRFDNLPAGQYLVEFVIPANRIVSPRNAAGATALNDSDADPATGRTVVITLPDGVTDLSWDAGIFVMPTAEQPTAEPDQRPTIFIPLLSR